MTIIAAPISKARRDSTPDPAPEFAMIRDMISQKIKMISPKPIKKHPEILKAYPVRFSSIGFPPVAI